MIPPGEQMGDKESGQISANAAEVYDQIYLPALFAEWSFRVLDAAQIQMGQRILDVACGTGVLAKTIFEQIGDEGSVVGVDNNEGMLAIARKKAPQIEWIQAPAEKLPLEDESFDNVVSQFGLMFFEDKKTALKEMFRVLRPNGNIVIVVWDSIKNIPGFAAENQLWQRLFGDESVDEVPYSLGEQRTLKQLFSSANIYNMNIQAQHGTARFPSIKIWMDAGVKGWAQDDMINDRQYKLLLKEAEQEFAHFVKSDGSVAFPTQAHIVTASKPADSE